MPSPLWINPLGPSLCIININTGETFSLEKNQDIARIFPKYLIKIIEEQHIDTIWCVSGPGAFTLMRIITLTLNTLRYTQSIHLKYCHFFELINGGNIGILEANAHEYLTGEVGSESYQKKGELKSGVYEGIFSENHSTARVKMIEYIPHTDKICEVFENKEFVSLIVPLYIKPPHITSGTKKL